MNDDDQFWALPLPLRKYKPPPPIDEAKVAHDCGVDWQLLTREDRVRATDQYTHDSENWFLATPAEVGLPPGFLSYHPVAFRRKLPIDIPFLTNNGFKLTSVAVTAVSLVEFGEILEGKHTDNLAVLKHNILPGSFHLNQNTNELWWSFDVFYSDDTGSTLTKRSEILTLLNLLFRKKPKDQLSVAYSRWDRSIWYTYWKAAYPENRTNALFVVHDVAAFHAAELRKDKQACLDKCRKICNDKQQNVPEPLLQELAGYMDKFLADVDERYPEQKHK